MKKKFLIIFVIVILSVLFFLGGELIGAFPWQYISKDKINAFVKDSSYAFAYGLPAAEDKTEWGSILTDDLADRITAACTARKNFSPDAQSLGLSYEITDTFLGLKGSEPTRVRVRYTLNGQQCELEYVLTEDKDSPYTFRVDDIEFCNEK